MQIRVPWFLIVSFAFLACFLTVAFSLNYFTSVNLGVNLWAASINHSPFTFAAEQISVLFGFYALALASVFVAIVLFAAKYRRYGALLLVIMAGDAVLVYAFKIWVSFSRPEDALIYASGYSFPSGHVAATVAFLGAMTFFAWRIWGSVRVKISTSVCYVGISILVGFDRIYLNVHWFSDVLGGLFLGIFWLFFVLFVYTFFSVTELVRN